jgi:hypothetical protein
MLTLCGWLSQCSAWRHAARRPAGARRCCGPSRRTCCTQRRTCSAGMIGDSSRDPAPNCCLLCRSLSLRLAQLACCVLQLTRIMPLLLLPFNVHQVLQSELPDGLGLLRAAAVRPPVSRFLLQPCVAVASGSACNDSPLRGLRPTLLAGKRGFVVRFDPWGVRSWWNRALVLCVTWQVLVPVADPRRRLCRRHRK